MSFRICVLVCGIAGALTQARDVESLSSVRFLPGDDAGLAEAGTLRIAQRAVERDGLLCLKPEHGQHLRFDEGTRGFVVQDMAQGGATVQNLDYLEFPLAVLTAGDYQVWYRAFYPRLGNWLHFEAMDDGETIRQLDNPKKPDLTGKWVWTKGPVYSLSKGDHVWKLDGWRGGTQLERVVFCRGLDYQPTDLGPEPTVQLAARNAHFTSAELAPGVRRWLRVRWTKAGVGGVKCFVSRDAKTWHETTNGADISALIKTPGMYVRFALAASPDAGSPIVQAIAVDYEPDPTSWKVLENGVARFVFTDRGVRELMGVRTGAGFRAPGTATEFFHIKVKKPGYGPETELRASRDAESRRIELINGVVQGEYRFLDGALVVRPTIALDADGRSRWRMQIENNSDQEVTSIRYPILRSAVVNGDGSDDILVVNSVWGQIIRNPAKWKQRYPTTPTLRWLDLYDEAGGVYLGDHHTNFEQFNDLAMYISPSEDGTAVDLSLQKFLRVGPGDTRELDHYVVAVHGTGWHAGADIYREEVVSQLRKPVYPEWLRWCDGWSNANGFWPGYGFNILQRYGELAREDGLPFMGGNRLAASSCAFGYGGFWPQSTPIGGTVQDLRQYFDEIRELGGDADFYIAWNLHSPLQCMEDRRVCGHIPRQWLPKDARFYTDDWYRHNASRPHSGEVKTVRDMKTQARMCPGAKGWQEYLLDWTETYVRDYRSYIYWDCTSIGIAYGLAGICQNREHGHDDYGVFYRETLGMLDRTTAAAREIDPDYVCSGEGCNDITGQTGILHMVSGVVNRNEINRYTVPDQILIDGSWNHAMRPELGGIERFNLVFLTGNRFDGLPHRQAGRIAKLATTAEYAHALLDLRRWTKQFLYPARFMDTVGLTIVDRNGVPVPNPPHQASENNQVAPVDGTQAKWFRLSDGDQEMCLVNTLNTAGRDDLELMLQAERVGDVAAAWVVPIGGVPESVAPRRVDGVWRCAFPTAKLATVLFVEQAFPIVRIDGPGVTVTCPDETVGIGVRLVNIESAPAHALLRWDGPAGCRTPTSVRVHLSPGELLHATVPLQVGRKTAMGRHDMHLLVEWQGRIGRIYQRLSVTDRVLVRLRDDDQRNVVLTFRNLSSEVRRLAGTLRVDAPLSPESTAIDVTLKPHERRAMNVALDGWNDVMLPLRANLELEEADRAIRKSLLMVPFVANGDFETDVVGDGYPEWWTGWTPRGPEDGYTRIHLDRERKASGRSSLRLDPDPREGYYTIAQPMVARLKADTEYEVSVDIYREQDTPGIHVKVGRLTLGKRVGHVGEWQHFEGRLKHANPTRFPDRDPAADWVRWIRLHNASDKPAWFDNLRIREAVGGRRQTE